LGNRGIPPLRRIDLRPSYLVEAAQELNAIIGPEEYYKWAKGLGSVVMNPEKYFVAINRRIRKERTMILAEFETPRTTIRAFGETPEECNSLLHEAWVQYAKTSGADPDYLSDYIDGGVNYFEVVIEPGMAFGDQWESFDLDTP
jgi:hypothetical protein